MLAPIYLEYMTNDIRKLYLDLEESVIRDISRRIAKDIKLTATADYQIAQMVELGYDLDAINREIVKTTNLSIKKVEELVSQSSYLSHELDRQVYAKGGKTLPAMARPMERMIVAQTQLAKQQVKNVANAYLITGKRGATITKQYTDALNRANFEVMSGAFTTRQATKKAVKTLINGDITKIRYESGVTNHIDVAVTRAVRTNIGQITGKISEYNADTMGQDLMEISSHIGARPSHSYWQGEIVSRSGADGYLNLGDIGYGEVTGFKGANCGHDWYPYFEGISTKMFHEEEPPPVEYNGRTYDSYEASQKQRYHERQMREQKRNIEAYRGAGLKNDLNNEIIKLRRQQEEYRKFSEAVGLRTKYERAGIVTKDKTAKVVTKTVAKETSNKVIKTNKYKSTKEAFDTISYRNIEKGFAKKIDDRLLDLQNTYTINNDLKIKSSSAKSTFGYSKHGVEVRTIKGARYLEFTDDIAYSNFLQRDEAVSLFYHTQEYKRRGSKLRDALGSIDHEYAHAIDNYYKLQKRPDIAQLQAMFKQPLPITNETIQKANQLNKEINSLADTMSNDLYNSMKNKLKLTNSEMDRKIKQELGAYAGSSKKEFLAEGFSNFRLLPKEERTDFIDLFEDTFNELFNSVKGG